MINKVELPNRIMSLDVESNGLWGKPISIGFTLEEDGVVLFKKEIAYINREKENYNQWVVENVIDQLEKNKNVTFVDSYEELLQKFEFYYNKFRQDYTVLYHMGHIVECNLFKELINYKLIGEWEAPYNPIEISMLLWVNGFKPDSCEELIKQGLVEKPNNKTKQHQALYDAEVAGKVYWYLKNKR